MTLIKTSLLNAIAVIVRMLTMLGINKLLAIYIGPSGYALIGQLQNSIQIATAFASGAINTGVTKYTAEYFHNENKQKAIWRTAGTIALAGSLVVGLLIAGFSTELAKLILHDPELGSVFIWFSVTLSLLVLNTLLLSILNGKKEINKYIIANIAGSFFSLFVTSLMVFIYGLYGALIALSIHQSISFFITLYIVYKSPWFKLKNLFFGIDKDSAINLSKYTAMALTSAACIPVSQILVRNYLGGTLSWEAAGYWEAMTRLSTAYLMFVTTTLSVYYLPRLSELTEIKSIKKEIYLGYKIILPTAIILSLTIYLFRNLIIRILFTEDFIPISDLFLWQMIGDTLKIGSWLLAYLMLSKAMVKIYIITEITFSITFYILATQFVNTFGLKGTTIAYALNYLLYWIVMAYLIVKKLKKSEIIK